MSCVTLLGVRAGLAAAFACCLTSCAVVVCVDASARAQAPTIANADRIGVMGFPPGRKSCRQFFQLERIPVSLPSVATGPGTVKARWPRPRVWAPAHGVRALV